MVVWYGFKYYIHDECCLILIYYWVNYGTPRKNFVVLIENIWSAELVTFFYCIHATLQAKSLVDPFAYDAYIEQRKKEKLDEERANRITVSYFFFPLKLYDIWLSKFLNQFINILVCYHDGNFINYKNGTPGFKISIVGMHMTKHIWKMLPLNFIWTSCVKFSV